MLEHTHSATWRATAGASVARRRAAHALLPWLQETKRAIVALGATYFSADDAQFRVEAAHLERATTAAGVVLRECVRDDRSDDLMQRLAIEFKALEVLAHECRRAPVGPQLTAQMRAAYMQMRDLGSALWEFEYMFEGNPRAKDDTYV
jgi:hypothetical protein